MASKRGTNLLQAGKATRFKKGYSKHPNAAAPFKKEFQGGKFAKEYMQDMAWAYKKLGGKKLIIAHIGRDPKLVEKFLDRLSKVAMSLTTKVMELEVSGQVDHVHRYGFDPEGLVGIMNQFKIDGDININLLMNTSVPALPEGEQHVLADVMNIKPLPDKVKVEKVKIPRKTLSFEEEERLALEGV